jgi:hypothetical protein
LSASGTKGKVKGKTPGDLTFGRLPWGPTLFFKEGGAKRRVFCP